MRYVDSCKLHFGVWLSIPNSGEGEGSCQLGINRRCCINPTFKSAANLPTVFQFLHDKSVILLWRRHFVYLCFDQITKNIYEHLTFT